VIVAFDGSERALGAQGSCWWLTMTAAVRDLWL
jgi:hypothetical protein